MLTSMTSPVEASLPIIPLEQETMTGVVYPKCLAVYKTMQPYRLTTRPITGQSYTDIFQDHKNKIRPWENPHKHKHP